MCGSVSLVCLVGFYELSLSSCCQVLKAVIDKPVRIRNDRLRHYYHSDLTDKMKRSFFQAAVVSILLYGCTTWTLTKRLEKKLDGNYTRMLRAILNKSRWQHPTMHQLYGHLPSITGCPRGVMVKAMNCGIVVREFVLQSRYYVHFRANTLGKGMNPLILPPAMGK